MTSWGKVFHNTLLKSITDRIKSMHEKNPKTKQSPSCPISAAVTAKANESRKMMMAGMNFFMIVLTFPIQQALL